MRTILITGASGFVGATLLESLRQQGYEVVAGVRNRARKLVLEQRGIKALVCDVADAINVARVIASAKPDGIIHLAGLAKPWAAEEEPLVAYQTIVTAWANILDGVRRSVPRARTLLVSAADVYGRACDGQEPLTEDVPPQPVSTFGSLKATAEDVAHTFHRNYHLDLTIARPFLHTGPGQSSDFFFGAVAHRLARWNPATDGSVLELPDLDHRRDVLHVADAAEAYEALLLNGKPNRVYNVCSGEAPTCRTLVEQMIREAGLELTLKDMTAEPDDGKTIPVLWGSNHRICQETGWHPTRTGSQAVSDLLAQCRSEQPANR